MKIAHSDEGAPIAVAVWNTSVNITLSGTSTQSAAIPVGVTVARLTATEPCWVVTKGTNPTATTSSTYLPAGLVEYVRVTAGDKIAALQAGSGGTLNITYCE